MSAMGSFVQGILAVHSGIQALVVGIAFWLAPAWGRRGHLFAVTVDPNPERAAETRGIVASYRRQVLAATVAALVVLVAFGGAALTASSWITLVQIGLCFAAYAVARTRVSPFAVAVDPTREVALRQEPEPWAGGPLGQLGPTLILGAAALVLWLRWDAVPATYVRHWNAALQPDGWGTKSWGSLGMPLVLGLGLTWLLQWTARSFSVEVRRVDARGEAAAAETARRRATARFMLVACYFLAFLLGGLALTPLFQSPQSAKWILVGTLTVGVCGGLGLMVYAGVTLMPHFQTAARGVESATDRTDDRYWKAGVFYYAPDDPALWVEKRFGMGYTLNMARAKAWVILGAILGLPLALAMASMIFD